MSKPVSMAASVLGKVKSPRKASASRANGRLGGRPSSGLTPERELRRRIREYVRRRGGSMAAYKILAEDAIAWRRALIGLPDPVSAVMAHPLANSSEDWRKLLVFDPVLL